MIAAVAGEDIHRIYVSARRTTDYNKNDDRTEIFCGRGEVQAIFKRAE